MPRSKVLQKKMFREFSKLNQSYVKKKSPEVLANDAQRVLQKQDIFEKELHFMLWAYDLEFWTLKHAAKDFNFSDRKIGERIVYPLMKEGLVYKHFDKLTPSQTREDHIFREETKYNYRVRYALTQKARLLVQAFYREMEE